MNASERSAKIRENLKISSAYNSEVSEKLQQVNELLAGIEELLADDPMQLLRVRSALASQLTAANTRDLGGF